ncbi:MAG: hypothetical protein HYW49_07865 [Deltaproteobacteria bacterium]|nr:hypothetical protein [Deltaproteobacteria bacterium]
MKVVALLCLLAASAQAAPGYYYMAEVRTADSAMSKTRLILRDPVSIQYAMSFARGVADQRIPAGDFAETDPLVLYISRLHECSRAQCLPVFGLYSGRAPH